MTTTATTLTLTVRLSPDNESAEIVLEGAANPRSDLSEVQLSAVSGIRVLPNGSENSNIVAVISTPLPNSDGFMLSRQLCDQVITAVLIAHGDEGEFNAHVLDDLTGREFFARVLRPQGPRTRNELISAETLKELEQKLDSPRSHEHSFFGADLPHPDGSNHFDYDSPFPTSSPLDDPFAQLFVGAFGEDFALHLLQAQQARQAKADKAQRELMQSLAGTEITLTVDEDGTFRLTGSVVYKLPAEPQD